MVALSEHTLIVLKVLSLCFLQKENTLLVFKVKFIKVYSLSLPLSLPMCLSEIALQQVSMFFRSDPKWEVLEPLRDMGKRT